VLKTLEKGKTITGEYYSNFLTRLDEKICEKRPGLQKIIFHQGNAPVHKSVLAMGKLRDLHYELLEHPLYSPDLAPSLLFSLPKTQTLPHWSVFFFESRGDCSHTGVFCRSYEEPLQVRDNGAGA
jgi:hypothetical protein